MLINIIFNQNWYISYPNKGMNVRACSDLEFYSDGMVFNFSKNPITLKRSLFYTEKCPAGTTRLKLRYLNLSKKPILLMLSSGNTSLRNSVIIKRSSFQHKSGQLSVIKNFGRPSCLTIAKISCRLFFQYAVVYVFMKRYASSFPTNDWTVVAKLCEKFLQFLGHCRPFRASH